jgi:hypothetical protein
LGIELRNFFLNKRVVFAGKNSENDRTFFGICQAFFEKTLQKNEKYFLKRIGEVKGCVRGKCYKIAEKLEVNLQFWRFKKS